MSIGISLSPNDATDVETLLKNADSAMYRAKEQGRNSYQFFTSQMKAGKYQRLLLETQLRHALERDELTLCYQPQIHLATGRIVGVEALLRWDHPKMGTVPPQIFIPLAEETGLIVGIGEWVLRQACLQHQKWRIQGNPILRIAVNLSSRQFKQENLTEQIIQTLEETVMDPNLLELELTESMLMQDADNATKTLHKLKEMGIQLAIDDFGTGYSSLSYLRRFPIDKLKIDKSFMIDIPINQDDMAIIRAIVALARTLNLTVIAEGVETKQQLAFLKSLRCDEIQGFLFGYPLPAEEISQLLLTSSPM
jgi:EAL domain-containing protein (putative c-di-GMP-specific phosphodiesterase class I)